MLEFLAAVAIIASCISTSIHAYIAYKRSKEPPKDPIWDAAVKITTSQPNTDCNVNEFAKAYCALKLFVDNGHSLNGIYPLDFAIIQRIQNAEESDTPQAQQQECPE